MSFVGLREVDVGELGYDAGGAGEPALLFLHGWCGDRSHFLQLEVPEQVNPMIERFLAVIPGGSLAAQ
jgi:predicted esterase